jgi:hypothetical protein
MAKYAAHVAKLDYIRKMCDSAESIHVETARLVELLSHEPRYATSAASLKPEPPRRPRKR